MGGTPDDVESERQCGRRPEPGVAVEQVAAEKAAARGDVGDGPVARRLLQRPGAAAVHELQVGDLPQLADDLPAPATQLRHRPALHDPDRPVDDCLPGYRVGDAGDLRLVRHHPDQVETVPRDDRPGEFEYVAAGMHRRTPDPDVYATAEETVRGVEVDGHANRSSGRRWGDGVDEVELFDRVDEQAHAARGHLVVHEGRERLSTHTRVTDEDVVDVRRRRQPVGFGEVVGEHAVEAAATGEVGDHRPHPEGFARDPDRDTRGAS